MKNRWKKICALLMTAIMVLPMGACGSKGSGSASGNKTSNTEVKKIDLSELDKNSPYPKLKKKVKLTVLVGKDTTVKDMETNEYITKLEKAVNVDLSFKYLPAGDDGKQKLSVMISSGNKLPDMVFYNLSVLESYTYGSQGYFLPLNNYIEKESKYFKDYLNTENGKENEQYIKSPDGNIYSFPQIVQEVANEYSHRMWINKTWLDKLGLEIPKTTDEYYNVLKAFKEKDPNGNGKADELPLIGSTTGWYQTAWQTLLYAFVYTNDTGDYLMPNDKGKLGVSYTTDGWKKGLAYLHKLCKDGLLSPLTFTQDENQLKQILGDSSGQVIGSLCTGSMSVYAASEDRKHDMTHMGPLTGPDGVCWTGYSKCLPVPMGFITKDCKDPVAAAAVYDYMYNEDQVRQGRWGTEGKSWVKAKAGEKGMYENLGYKPVFNVTDNIWGTTQNQQLGEKHPTFRSYEMTNGQVLPDDPYNAQRMSAEALPDYIDKKPDNIVYRLDYTKDEADQITDILTSLNTYRDEATTAFITGTRPISDWDKYLKDLEGIGLPKFLEVAQKAYDRMNKK